MGVYTWIRVYIQKNYKYKVLSYYIIEIYNIVVAKKFEKIGVMTYHIMVIYNLIVAKIFEKLRCIRVYVFTSK